MNKRILKFSFYAAPLSFLLGALLVFRYSHDNDIILYSYGVVVGIHVMSLIVYIYSKFFNRCKIHYAIAPWMYFCFSFIFFLFYLGPGLRAALLLAAAMVGSFIAIPIAILIIILSTKILNQKNFADRQEGEKF